MTILVRSNTTASTMKFPPLYAVAAALSSLMMVASFQSSFVPRSNVQIRSSTNCDSGLKMVDGMIIFFLLPACLLLLQHIRAVWSPICLSSCAPYFVVHNTSRLPPNYLCQGNVAAGAAIGVAGFAFGIGMVAFAEAQVGKSSLVVHQVWRSWCFAATCM